MKRTEDWFGNSVHKLDSYAYKNHQESAASSAESANTALEGSFHPTSRGTAVRVDGRSLAYGLEIWCAARVSANGGTVVSAK